LTGGHAKHIMGDSSYLAEWEGREKREGEAAWRETIKSLC
jgi:hypothetical protein